jgi:GPH family glycoside/pentoside/hexuronide:cation symporter
MAIFSTLAVVFFFITFATTSERIQPAPDQKASIGQHFRDLLSNGPWMSMFVLTLVLFITLAMRGSAVLYYFRYFVQREDLFSIFNVAGTSATIVGVILSKPLAVRFGKRNVFIASLAGTVLLTAVFYVLPPEATTAMIATEALRQFVYGFSIPLLWAMMGDVADYSEWRNRRRATAIVFSAIVFALKAGLGFGGAIAGFVLASYGYVPNVAQSAGALQGIVLMMSLFPAALFAVCTACLFFYGIDKRTEIVMAGELDERRRGFANA